MAKQVFTLKTLCDYLLIDKKTAYKLLQSGELQGIKKSYGWRIHEDWVREYLAENRNEATY